MANLVIFVAAVGVERFDKPDGANGYKIFHVYPSVLELSGYIDDEPQIVLDEKQLYVRFTTGVAAEEICLLLEKRPS